MEETLLPLDLPPGLYRNGTAYQAKGRWYDANLIRFFDGTIRPIGGWERAVDATGAEIAALEGCPRGAYAYRGNDGTVRIAFGTTEKLYVINDGLLVDITPSGTTNSLVTGSCLGVQSGSGRNYGDGDYGSGPYGSTSILAPLDDADTWSLDSFGDYLIGCLTSDGRVLVWQGDPLVEADEATGAPTGNRAVVCTPERYLVALGGTSVAGGDPDGRLVRWATQETIDDWTPTASNTSGEFPLTTAGLILTGRRTRRQTLIWTDIDIHTMTFIGGTFVFQFDQMGTDCGLLGPNAVGMVGDKAYWMSKGGFFVFEGFTRRLRCEVEDHVFSDFNFVNRHLIHCQGTAEFDEVTWYYPSAGSDHNDRYVTYNHREDHWTVGELGRETGVDRGACPIVLLVDEDGILWRHEFGSDHADLTPFIESGPMEPGNGDKIFRVQRVVPDEKTRGDLSLKISTALFPMETPVLSATVSLDSASPIDVRFTGRQMTFRFEEARETDWRLGKMRLGARPQGRR